MCPQMIFGLAIFALLTLGSRVTAYTNQWAVHIEGGPETAQRVATDHGFQYLDKVPSNASLTLQKSRKPLQQFKRSLSEDNVRAQLLQRNTDLQELQKLPGTGKLPGNNAANRLSRRSSDYVVDQEASDYAKCRAGRKTTLISPRRSNSETRNSPKSDSPVCFRRSCAITKGTRIKDYPNCLQDLDTECVQPSRITSRLSLSNFVRHYTQDVTSRQYGSRSTKDSEQRERYATREERQSADHSGNEHYAQGRRSPESSNEVNDCPRQPESPRQNHNQMAKSANQERRIQRHEVSAQETRNRDYESAKCSRQREVVPRKPEPSPQQKSNEPVEGCQQRDRSINQQCRQDGPPDRSNQLGFHYEQEQQQGGQPCQQPQKRQQCRQQQCRQQQQPQQCQQQQQPQQCQQQQQPQQCQQQQQPQQCQQQGQQQCSYQQQQQQQEQRQCSRQELQQQCPYQQQQPHQQQCDRQQQQQQQQPQSHLQQCDLQQQQQQQQPQSHLQQCDYQQQQQQQPQSHLQQCDHQQQQQQQPQSRLQQCDDQDRQPDQQHGEQCRDSDQQHPATMCDNLSTSPSQQNHCPTVEQSAESACEEPATVARQRKKESGRVEPPWTKQKRSESSNQSECESLREKLARLCGSSSKKPSMAEGLVSRFLKCKSPEAPATCPEPRKAVGCESKFESPECSRSRVPAEPGHWSEKKSKPGPRCPRSGTELFVPFRGSTKPKSKWPPAARKIDPGNLIHDPTAKRQRGTSAGTESKSKSGGSMMAWQKSSTSNSCIIQFDDQKNRCFELPRGGKTGEDLRTAASFAALGSSSFRKPTGTFKLEDVGDTKPNMSALKYRLAKCPSVKQMWQHADCQLPEVTAKPVKVPRPSPVTRRRVAQFEGTGEWKDQKYPIRLRIFRSKDCLDPCKPATTDVCRDRNSIDSSAPQAPMFKHTDHDKSKMVCPCAPPPRPIKKNVPTLMKESSAEGRKAKKAKTCLPCPKS